MKTVVTLEITLDYFILFKNTLSHCFDHIPLTGILLC